MVKHIFTLIWNEKRANAWLFAEYVLVFCILWYCSDFIYNVNKAIYSDIGYDITDTFKINMSEKPQSVVAEENGGKNPGFSMSEMLETVFDRISRHPDVESVGASVSSLPYMYGIYMGDWRLSGLNIPNDSLPYNLIEHGVTDGFFDVFRITPAGGRLFDWQDPSDRQSAVLVPLNDNGDFGSAKAAYSFSGSTNSPIELYNTYYAGDIERITGSFRSEDDATKYVVGYTRPLRRSNSVAFRNAFFTPLDIQQFSLSMSELAVRVKPGRAEGFEERFMADMSEQLHIGSYYLGSVQSFDELKKISTGFTLTKLKTVYAITFFILVNIFLGILGTFWFRTQARRSEIGLRMALGSSRKKVIGMFAGETLMLLFLASVVGLVICLNIDNDHIFNGIFSFDFSRAIWGITGWQDVLNYIFAFLFLAGISLFAVWYPAKQAADTQPAQVLHEE
ncbi:MAG: FtsX-like permease family protein [Alistipes sp.]|nr:FtsX-like permease family protein [Alistipes sp.]